MSAPPAAGGGRACPLFIIFALSALSWIILVALAFGVWMAL